MIGFRVDANETIATGHLMRCLAIALECRRQGEDCVFFLAEDKETRRLKENDIRFRILHSCWKEMEAELELFVPLLKEEGIDRLVVDSYQATEAYLKRLQQAVPVLYVDDFGSGRYDVSAVLHYVHWYEDTAYERRYNGTQTKLLLGMKYAPLREEFAGYQPSARQKKILITTGGTDPYNAAGRVLKRFLEEPLLASYSFEVIVGSMNMHREFLENLAIMNDRIHLRHNVKNMAEFMRMCECAVSAGGTTLFELCASRIPTVCFSFADNQLGLTKGIGDRDIMLYAGDARYTKRLEEEICCRVLFFTENEKNRQQYARRMGSLVDGKGTERIAAFLCKG